MLQSQVVRSLARGLLFLAPLAALGACQQTPVEDLGVTSVQFRDVRVPREMRLVASKAQSHSNEAGEDYRYGDFEYVGPLPVDAVAGYLEDAMPQHGWELTADNETSSVDQPRILKFKRGVYDASFALSRNETKTRMTVEVRTQPGRTN